MTVLTILRRPGRLTALVLLTTTLGLAGCNSDNGGAAALPPTSALPAPSKADLGPDGRATHSTPSLDTARGAAPSK